MCDALHYLFDNIFIIFLAKLYGHLVGSPMVTNCNTLAADLFYFVIRDTSFCLFLTII